MQSVKEKKEVKEMYKYKEAFRLRDEVGTCPNIEIDAIDKPHFSLDHTM